MFAIFMKTNKTRLKSKVSSLVRLETVGIGLSVMLVGSRCGKLCRGQFCSLIEAYISNLSILMSLEPSEKFVVVGGGGGG